MCEAEKVFDSLQGAQLIVREKQLGDLPDFTGLSDIQLLYLLKTQRYLVLADKCLILIESRSSSSCLCNLLYGFTEL